MKKEKTTHILGYIIVILLIISTNTVYSLIYDRWLIIICFINFINLKLFLKRQIIIPKILMLLLLLIFISMIFNRDYNGRNFELVIIIIMSYFTCLKIKFRKFSRYFVKIIYCTSLFSLLLWVGSFFLAPTFNYISPTYKLYESYFGIYFRLNGVISNSFLFTEPGIYQYYLNFAIMFNLFVIEKKFNFKTWIIIIVLITTFSTAGYFILIMTVLIYLISKEKFHKRKMLGGISISIIILLYLSISYILGDSFIMDKVIIYKLKSGNLSYDDRINSFLAPFVIGTKNFIYGGGLGHTYLNLSKESAVLNKKFTHLTSTFATAFSSFGVLYFIIVVSIWLKLGKLLNQKKLVSLLIFVPTFIILNTQNLTLSMLYNVLFMYIVMFTNKKKIRLQFKF